MVVMIVSHNLKKNRYEPSIEYTGSYQDHPSWRLSGWRNALDRQSASAPDGFVSCDCLTLNLKIKNDGAEKLPCL